MQNTHSCKRYTGFAFFSVFFLRYLEFYADQTLWRPIKTIKIIFCLKIILFIKLAALSRTNAFKGFSRPQRNAKNGSAWWCTKDCANFGFHIFLINMVKIYRGNLTKNHKWVSSSAVWQISKIPIVTEFCESNKSATSCSVSDEIPYYLHSLTIQIRIPMVNPIMRIKWCMIFTRWRANTKWT